MYSKKKHFSVCSGLVSNVTLLPISNRLIDKTWQFHSPKQHMAGWMKTQTGKLMKKRQREKCVYYIWYTIYRVQMKDTRYKIMHDCLKPTWNPSLYARFLFTVSLVSRVGRATATAGERHHFSVILTQGILRGRQHEAEMCEWKVSDCNRTKLSHNMGNMGKVSETGTFTVRSKQILHGPMVGQHSDIALTILLNIILITFCDNSPKPYFSSFKARRMAWSGNR